MQPSQHATTSVGAGVILGLMMRSWVAGAACGSIGILIDLDHLFDFWLNCGFSLDRKKFFDFCYNGTAAKFYDILHGYEYIPLFWWLTTVPGLGNLGWGLTIGYVLHLLEDQFFNYHLNRWTYFLSFRIFHCFDSRIIVRYNPFLESGRARPTFSLRPSNGIDDKADCHKRN